VGFFYGAYRLLEAGLDWAGSTVDASTVGPAAILVVGLLMLPQLSVLQAQAQRPYPGGYYNYFQSANELGQRQGCNGTVVSCRKPALFYLFSNCSVTRYAFSTDEEAVIRDMVRENVDYVVLDQLGFSSTPRYLYPAIKKHRDLFRAVIKKEKPQTFVLQFDANTAKAQLGTE
jgi:hypothetical protein